MVKVKGSIIKSVFSYFEDRDEEENLEKVREEVDSSMSEHIESPVISLQWYPIEFLEEVHRACENLYDGNIHRKLGRHSAKKSFGKFYEGSITSEELNYILDKMFTIWRMYYSSGDFNVIERDDNSLRLELNNFTFSEEFLYERVLGYMESTIEMSDIEIVNSEFEPIDSESCQFYLEWE